MPIFFLLCIFLCVFLHTSLVGKFIEPRVNAFILSSRHISLFPYGPPVCEEAWSGNWLLEPATCCCCGCTSWIDLFSLVTFPPWCLHNLHKLEFPFRKLHTCHHKAPKESYFQENSFKSMLRFLLFQNGIFTGLWNCFVQILNVDMVFHYFDIEIIQHFYLQIPWVYRKWGNWADQVT